MQTKTPLLVIIASLVFLNFMLNPGISSSQSVRQELKSHTIRLECISKTTAIPVDPVIVRPVVPPEYELWLDPNGAAHLQLWVKSCSKLMVNGKDVGKGTFITIGVKINGPYEVIPVPGAKMTLPTFYFYSMEDRSDNEDWLKAGKEAGLNFKKIKSMEWVTTGFVQPGNVVEKGDEGDKETPEHGYSWVEQVKPFSPSDFPAGMNLKIRHGKMQATVQCLALMRGKDSVTTIEAGKHSSFNKLYRLSGTLSGTSFDTEFFCDGSWTPVK